ncbi:3-oxoadipate enol-lactonase [Roseibaca sp. V10]|uniref:3-oxoadipate enol-lactonase n=1 Tax=Roseinatronobacter domitianus TaxID=2940293 RepID=A0ABT0M2Z8_9RHOB|nr:3-oxoadipate enol-lactonase [Roseibaca domitiana]MCL1629235.1 3-oxoadipate enol-lactonase [Roseibaca domitiana]
MPIARLEGVERYYELTGPEDGLPLVLSNSLGCTLNMWDPLLPHLPDGLRVLRYDRRGHGLSSVPQPPYSMGQLVRDTEQLLDHLALGPCVFLGLSIGGMVAQGLAVKRPDLLRALILSNTAARIATAEIWQERAATARAQGLGALADATMERWFTAQFRATPEFAPWREMFLSTPLDGWIGCAQAIAGTDFYTTTAALRLPTLGIAGDRDGSTPPDLVRETIKLIPGADFALLRRAGHLPHVEKPAEYAALIVDFLTRHQLHLAKNTHCCGTGHADHGSQA